MSSEKNDTEATQDTEFDPETTTNIADFSNSKRHAGVKIQSMRK